MGLSDNQKLLLVKAARNGGVLKAQTAHNIYSSPQSAKSALATLTAKRYLSIRQPGVFELEKLPSGVRKEYDLSCSD